ncbi:heterokaryon incompatibility protein-domain-containing protein [Immersiella caudata]|uniref:Heterokaryon incompatibility protein-domain-containing protein n=1 Tax=Immersiella caudata TaxID=314043 RepID=A0AA40BTY3_9PEZI|nr:heterokaryon incompatibility protein-domain-containing protein [Immersiella caudata]
MTDNATWKGCTTCRDMDRNCPAPLHPRRPKGSNFRYLTQSSEDVEDEQKLLQLYRSLEELQSSAKEGCRTCAAAAEALLFFKPDWKPSNGVDVVLSPRGNPQIWLPGRDVAIQFYTPCGFEPAWPGLRFLPEISPSPCSSEAIAFAKECLNGCLREHDGCNATGQMLPTRLISVGATGESRVRLIESKTASNTQYVALSYCWGQGNTFRTVGENLRSNMSGIPVAALPATLQDAVQITRQLEIPYLWIDSICIVQDDELDWRTESAKMGLVYQNSLLTVAAASSPSADHGFLKDRTKPKEFSVEWTCDDGSKTVLKARVDPTYHKSIWELLELPWNHRGWTLQEQVLCTRLLAFADAEVQWRCPSAYRCECRGIDGWSDHWSRMLLKEFQSTSSAYVYWHRLIKESYSPRLFTQYRDKLPAISGVASIIQQQTSSTYLGGLWVENIPLELCWSRHKTGKRIDFEPPLSEPEYRAPSFSWASIDGPVSYWDPCGCEGDAWVPQAQCLEATSEVIADNPFGQVSDARLTLRGLVGNCVLRVPDHLPAGAQRWLINGDKEHVCFVDDNLCIFSYEDDSGNAKVSPARWTSIRTTTVKPVERSPREVSAQLILLGSSVESCNNYRCNYFMILGRSLRDPNGAFERIGLYAEDVLMDMDEEPAVLPLIGQGDFDLMTIVVR